MKKAGLVIMASVAVLLAQAQMPGAAAGRRMGQMQSATGRFYGRVVDAANKGIDAATVTLVTKKMDSLTKVTKEVVVGGMLTNASGDFSIESVPVMGKYTLKISGIGYKEVDMPLSFSFNRPANGQPDPSAIMAALDTDLGNITLQADAQVLAGVTVTATKPLLQLGIDRKIFNVDKNITSAGGSAVDVMKNVPSVSVDLDGNVTLRNSSPQIFVDGRPTNLTLEQIPADVIESVEIITNPSAKFDASGGTSGILNIVLKKNRRVGYSGNIRANVDSRGRVGGGGDINVRQGKVNFFASGMYNPRKSISTGFTDRVTKGNGDTSYFSHQVDDGVFLGRFGFGRVGFDFFLDNRNTLTVNGSIVRGNMDPYSSSSITIDSLKNGSRYASSLQERVNNNMNTFKRNGGQVSFKHLFPKAGHELSADLTINGGTNSNETDILSRYYALPSKNFLRNYRQLQSGNGVSRNMTFQTDYAKPLSDNSKLEMGIRAATEESESSNRYWIVNPNGSLTPLTSQNIDYNSTNKVYAAYGTFTSRIKNFGYQLGLRAESSQYEGELVGKNQNFSIDFPLSLFPTVFLSQKVGDRDEFQLNYSRRINRPNFFQLFPFTDISDSLNVSRGNPGLAPEFTNSIEFSYSKVFENRDNFLASLYFKNTNDLITRYQTLEYVPAYNQNLIVSSYVNANRSYITGLELTSKNAITKFWDLTSNVNFFTAKIDLQNQPDQNQFLSYFAKLNNTFKLPKSFSVQLSGEYTSKVVSNPGGGGGRGGYMFGGSSTAAQGYIKPSWFVEAGVRYDFLKENRASISVNMSDILKTRIYAYHSESPFFVQDSERRRDWQVVRVNFSYRFGKFDTSLFKRRNNKADSNVNMDGGF